MTSRRLEGIETVLLDLDGTLYVGSRVVEGAPEAVRWLREQGLAVRFCTNTDSVTPAELAGRLGRRGFPVDEDELAYDDLDAAFRAVRDGAELLATQVNRVAVRDDGEHLDTGGWVRLLEYATGATARVLGKPSPEFFTAPLEALGRAPGTALVVGDDLEADIAGGSAVGAVTVLVRTGKGDPPAGTGVEPGAVIDSVADLPDLLRG